jgi:hypothetical protein
VQVRDYTEGQFELDLFNVTNRAPVWHGIASKTIGKPKISGPLKLLGFSVVD